MQYSCCAEVEDLDAVAKSGFDGIVLRGSYLAFCQDDEILRLKEKLQGLGLKAHSVNAFCPPDVKLTGPEYDQATLQDYTKRLSKNAAQLGIRCIGIGSPNSRQLPAGYSQALAKSQWENAITTIAAICAPYGMEVLIEPLCTRECNWITNLSEAVSFLHQFQLEQVGLVFDLYHACVMKDDPSSLLSALPYIKVVHIAQDHQKQKYFPLTGMEATFKPYCAILRDGGFQGEFAVEATIRTGDDFHRSLQIMKELLQ